MLTLEINTHHNFNDCQFLNCKQCSQSKDILFLRKKLNLSIGVQSKCIWAHSKQKIANHSTYFLHVQLFIVQAKQDS
jgi:hypothetical protein